MIDEDYSGTGGASPAVIGSAGGIAATAVAAALALFSVTAGNEQSPSRASAASASVAQRTFGASPTTGTLTTRAPTAAWAATTAYVLDPTSGGINRVTNVGNLYQCRTPGTSASSGGPTTQAADITDGTAHWTYEGPAPTTDVLTGSQIIGFVARGDQTTITTPQIPPTDNDGGTYTAISNTSYSGFPASFAGVFQRAPASNGKTGLTASAAWGNASGGDEVTTGFVELRGVLAGAPHTFSQVERANATANIDTAANITTSVPCLILSFWFGNGNVLTGGTSHPATPLGGLQLIPGATALMAISGGYIQVGVAWRIEPAARASFAESWQTTGEGAQLFTVAYALGAAAPIEDHSDPWRPGPFAALALARAMPGGEDELPVTTAPAVVDEADSPPAPVWSPAIQRAAAPWQDDDPPALVASAPPIDDPWTPFAWPAPPRAPAIATDTDEAPALYGAPEELGAPPPAMAALAWRATVVLDADEPPIAPYLSVDEEPWSTWRIQPIAFAAAVIDAIEVLAVLTVGEEDAPPAAVPIAGSWRAALVTGDEDLPIAPAVVDEEPWVAPRMAATGWAAAAQVDGTELLAVLTAFEDDAAPAGAMPALVWRAAAALDADEVPAAAVAAIAAEDDPWVLVAQPAVVWRAAVAADPDEQPSAVGVPFEDDGPRLAMVTQAWRAGAFTDTDDLPVALTTAALDEDAAVAPAMAPTSWRAFSAPDDEVIATAAAPAIAAEDDPVRAAQAPIAWVAAQRPLEDELPLAAVVAEEDAPPPQPASMPPWARFAPAGDDDLPVVIAPVEYEPLAAVPAAQSWPRAAAPADDDPPLTPPVIIPIAAEDDGPVLRVIAPIAFAPPLVTDEGVLASAVPPPFYAGPGGGGEVYADPGDTADFYPQPVPGGFYG